MDRTPSMVVFAKEPMTPLSPLSPDSQSEFEFVEMQDMEGYHTPQRHIVTI
jgi:hypothetical protein